MLIDSHTHLNFKAYNKDLSEVIARCNQANMKLINVGAAFPTSEKAVDLALQETNFYASVGLHPIHVFDEEFSVEANQELIDKAKNKVVAVGETGFDFFHTDTMIEKGASSVEDVRSKQEDVFRKHIKLAQDNNLALIVHGRHNFSDASGPNAYEDIHRVLVDEKMERGVVHCFGGNPEEAQNFLDIGFYIGFTGIITFDKTGNLETIVKNMPEEKILIETDAPYLTPTPHRGKRNEPIFVKHVAEKIAEIKKISVDEVIELTGDNATRLFNLK